MFRWQRERKLQSLVQYPNIHNSWIWTRLKPATRNSVQLFHGPVTWAIICCFPRHFTRKLGFKWGARNGTCHPEQDVSVPRVSLTYCTTTSAPNCCLWSSIYTPEVLVHATFAFAFVLFWLKVHCWSYAAFTLPPRPILRFHLKYQFCFFVGLCQQWHVKYLWRDVYCWNCNNF